MLKNLPTQCTLLSNWWATASAFKTSDYKTQRAKSGGFLMKSLLSARPGRLQEPLRPPADSPVPSRPPWMKLNKLGLFCPVSTPLSVLSAPSLPLSALMLNYLVALCNTSSRNSFKLLQCPTLFFCTFINVIDSVSHVRSLLLVEQHLHISLFDSFHLCLTRTRPECNEEEDQWGNK